MDGHFLLQGIFPTQGSNPRLLCLQHCGWILYLLSHQGSSNREMAFCNSFLIPCVLTSLFINEEFKGSFRVLAFFTSRHKASWRPWSFFLMAVQCFLNTRFTIDGHLAVSVLCTYKQWCTFCAHIFIGVVRIYI